LQNCGAKVYKKIEFAITYDIKIKMLEEKTLKKQLNYSDFKLYVDSL